MDETAWAKYHSRICDQLGCLAGEYNTTGRGTWGRTLKITLIPQPTSAQICSQRMFEKFCQVSFVILSGALRQEESAFSPLYWDASCVSMT
jgi:hypothetical protein